MSEHLLPPSCPRCNFHRGDVALAAREVTRLQFRDRPERLAKAVADLERRKATAATHQQLEHPEKAA